MRYVVWIAYEDEEIRYAHTLYAPFRTFTESDARNRAEQYKRSLTAGPDSEDVYIVPKINGKLDFEKAEEI